MTPRLLIEAIVRQMTVLIAELATSGGMRAPLADIADRVFLELTRELESHGVSRTVGADMFGMALRTYLRRIRRFDESSTQRGKSLWEAVLGFVQDRGTVTRADVLSRFANDEELLVRGVLQDLTDSGLLARVGPPPSAIYRAAAPGELPVARSTDPDDLDTLLWALIRHEGPLSEVALQDRIGVGRELVRAGLANLERTGRVRVRVDDGVRVFLAESIVLPLGARAGWEAGVYDHVQAVVKTILCKLRQDDRAARQDDRVGGSTYTFAVWEGHPLADAAYTHLAQFRKRTTDLRAQIAAYNAEHGTPSRYDRVTVYLGQCVISEEADDASASA